jgi:hypothetical protein
LSRERQRCGRDAPSPAARLIALLDHLGIAKRRRSRRTSGLAREQAERLGAIVLGAPVRLDPAPFAATA